MKTEIHFIANYLHNMHYQVLKTMYIEPDAMFFSQATAALSLMGVLSEQGVQDLAHTGYLIDNVVNNQRSWHLTETSF